MLVADNHGQCGGQGVTDVLRWAGPGFGDDDSRADSGPSRRNGRSLLLLGAAVVGLGGSVFFGIGYWRYERLINAEHAAAAHAEIANADLQDALARLRDQVAASDQALTTAQTRLSSLSDEASKQLSTTEQSAASKADRITQLTHALEQAQRELHLTEVQRVTLLARLSKAEADVVDTQSRQQQTQAGIDQWQKKVQQLTGDRDKAAAERDQLRTRIEELQQKLSMKESQRAARALAQAAPAPAAATPGQTQAAQIQAAPARAPQVAVVQPNPAVSAPARAEAPVAVAMAAPIPAAAAPAVVPVVAAAPARAEPIRTGPSRPAVGVVTVPGEQGHIVQFERVLASAGVDVRHLFAQFGVSRGEGGPFVPASVGAHLGNGLTPEKLAALSRLVKVLPVTAPLESYTIGSPFGARGDPINGRASFHTGLDFDAPYMSPVYATAPGVVTFSGYRNDYGKIVEIDHGNGITTRYAHMHRALVSVGQHVEAHTQIGFLGSTGRATGPHVHYEVLVNGEPQDPAKFLSLGHLVQVSAQR